MHQFENCFLTTNTTNCEILKRQLHKNTANALFDVRTFFLYFLVETFYQISTIKLPKCVLNLFNFSQWLAQKHEKTNFYFVFKEF